MTYCPVLLQIQHEYLRNIFKGEYLLQVYNIEGTCVFDKVLKCKCDKICITIFIYNIRFGNINSLFLWIPSL
jgi:hypothetical protein